jgi:hypothetical protein
MKRYLLGTLLFVTISCSDKEEAGDSGQISIDSIFVSSYKVSGLKEITGVKDFMINDNDDIFELAKTKMLFHEHKSFKVSDNVEAKVLLTSMTPDFIGDGTLKIVYLVTFGTDGKQIDILRIGKMEEISDIRQIETGEVKGDSVLKQNRYLSLELDSLGQGGLVEKKFQEKFRIKNNGKFERL